MWLNQGKWQVNPLNFSDEVRRDYEARPEIFMLDSTIRNMTAIPGSRWDVSGAVAMATLAAEIGVRIIEIDVVHGTQPPTPQVMEMFRKIRDVPRQRMKVFGSAWARKDSVDQVLDAGADGVIIEPDPVAVFRELAAYARSRGALVATTLGGRIEHMAPPEAAARLDRIVDLELAYVSIHENTNATVPEAWRYYLRTLLRLLVKPIDLVPHLHNNFGLGTAAAVAAVTGGAAGIDAAMNGLGIHAGLAALDEVVVALEILYGVRTGIDLSRLTEYSRLAAEVSGIPVHPYKPLVGDYAFVAELDPFVRSVLEMRGHGHERVHPIAPSLVGNRWTPFWGVNTLAESSATALKLAQLRLPHDEASVALARRELSEAIKAKTEGSLALAEHEVETILTRMTFKNIPGTGA